MKAWMLRTGLVLALAASAAWLSGPSPAPAQGNPALVGIWERTDLQNPELLRYYFFHPTGIGLYRYGKNSLNHTEIFEYETKGQTLRLRFRKSKQRASVPFSVERKAGHSWLRLHKDPRERQRSIRYRLRPAPEQTLVPAEGHPFARTWLRRTPEGFRMYQFQPPDRNGRGNGWFHFGDFDEWTTESLTYRRAEGSLDLRFDLTKEEATTPYREFKRAKRRYLELDVDPRNYWHHQVLQDAGPSFMSQQELFFIDR